MYQNHEYPFPCLCCHPHSYIRMVQNLIERCLLLGMDRDQCVKALAIHARISPLVTLTVWRELLKENKDFFQVYFNNISSRPFLSNAGIIKENQDLEEENNGNECKLRDRYYISKN